VDHIRNFSIIAHIDHGKSTLADRILEVTRMLTGREKHAQVLDSMDLEQERGITIKSHAVRMPYTARDGREYTLNLIDTPGHVDFTYEVSRSLAACEGAILVVDATQGVEAQTLSNLFLALDNNLEIIPVINKIDLQSAHPDEVCRQIVDLIGCAPEDVLRVSAKEGIGIDEVLEAIVLRVPAPRGGSDAPLRAMIFDSLFDSYRGAIPYVRVVDGKVKKGDWIRFFAHKTEYEVDEVGYLQLKRVPTQELAAGEVGYIIANIRQVQDTRVGDTITTRDQPATERLAGFRDVKPMVYSGLYPTDSDSYAELREALGKLQLNDAALVFEPESSAALGFGFRCGFLGLLHMEIVQERLSREFELEIITTVPNVEYWVFKNDGTRVEVDSPAQLPKPTEIDHIQEPYVKAQIILPAEYIGNIMKLCLDRRGIYKTTEYADTRRAILHYEMPLAEIIFDFYDKLKSLSRGYASLDYEFADYREGKLVKLDILINGDPVDALSALVHSEHAFSWGQKITAKLKELIPRQMFEVVIQAAIGSRVVARSSVRPMRKNVTAKCYGGDITRKRKLLERQKEGKRRMKQVGSVEIPQEAFLAVLKVER
jgi:GTP-binding protein LepA